MPGSTQSTEKSNSQLSVPKKIFKSAAGFINKFNNDWTMQSAGALAYNLMVAIVPIVIAIIAGFGFTIGALSPAAKSQFMHNIETSFHLPGINLSSVLEPALNSLNRNAGLLGIIALLLAIFGGSRLFIAIEGCFDIIYRTRPRQVIAQNIMAILMMILFIVLIPLMVFTSSVPTLISSIANSAILRNIPAVSQILSNGFFISVISILIGLIIAWILFEAIFLFVPNQKISFRGSWGGALLSAVLLEVFLFFFPIYVSRFMGSYTGAAGFAVILLLFFYYFAVILLLGAQVNAYFAERVTPLPSSLATVLCEAMAKRNGRASAPAAPAPASQPPTARENTPGEQVNPANNSKNS